MRSQEWILNADHFWIVGANSAFLEGPVLVTLPFLINHMYWKRMLLKAKWTQFDGIHSGLWNVQSFHSWK